ncbi:lytic transglycosylase domain-containing protein [Pedobacter frigiditerrae]|uniref:Lytic transglycosylase domain-containing protein n=1 Tax=Pedobacter frigiditerrae TaxID=2530452 RepID=A0A4R0N4T5_9SPHI|nr:lytic transglycosylase domain-containing protein [Pedobacter frigiditerrae]TCC94397.1 lytic transglycosylase domain-containing protein [Pedobacter frigiditerrae]
MIKKHIIPCTVILTLLVMAQVFAYTLPTVKKDLKNNNLTTIKKEAEEPAFTLAQLEFAEETLPLGDTRINSKMKRILASYGYENLQTNRLHRKAAEWFPIIEPILAAYGIPNDFKYVPLVESGLQGGTSPKGASGYWQFMPGTARTYGLKVNGRVDERQNLRKSTIAACKYIKELYGIFDSWTLVAAAYNVGDVHMKRQINKQNQDNYFKMKLNRETGGYVYKLISMKEILENPQRNGYKSQKAFIAYVAPTTATVE